MKGKKSAALFLAVLVLLFCLFGCAKKDAVDEPGETTTSTQKEETTAETDTAAKEEQSSGPVTIEMVFIASNMIIPEAENDIFRREILDRLNIEIQPSALNYLTQDEYNKRLTLLAASADWPEVLISDIFSFTTSIINTAGESGFLHDFTEDLQAPGREAYVELASAGIEFNKDPADGALYKLPAVVSGMADYEPASAAVNIRMDLLDKLNVGFPTNPDEFYQLLVKIKQEGKAADGSEMIPLSLPEGLCTGQGWTNYMILNNWLQNNEWEWDEDAGMFVRPIWSNFEGFEKLCVFFNKLYNEGLLDRETFIQKNSQLEQKMAEGKVGVSSMAWWTLKGINNSLEQVDPDMYYGYMPPFADASVVDLYQGCSYWNGGYGVLSASNDLSEEKLGAIWKLMDYLITEEGTTLLRYGVEGETFAKFSEGYYDYTDEVKAKIEDDKDYLAKIGINAYHRILYNCPFYYTTISPNIDFKTRRDFKQMAKITNEYKDQGLIWERTVAAFYVDAGPEEAARDSNIREAQADLFVQAVTAKDADAALELAKSWPEVADSLGMNLIYDEKMELVSNR